MILDDKSAAMQPLDLRNSTISPPDILIMVLNVVTLIPLYQ